MGWIDVGCADFKAAARNRKMVAGKEHIEGYVYIESLVKSWPRRKPLPQVTYNAGRFQITLSGGTNLYGKLPFIDKSERRNINQYGIYEIGTDGLIKVDKQRNKYYNEDVDE